MKKRNVIYFSRNKALKIMERPMQADLVTFLSATFALSRSKVVKNHIQQTLLGLDEPFYKMSA